MAEPVYDVCVVDSGPGGGIAAYALSSAGLKVALVEAGPALRAGVDFGVHSWPYESREKRRRAGFTTPVEQLFRDRAERNHFTPVGDRPGHGWLKAVGGRSLCWAGHSYGQSHEVSNLFIGDAAVFPAYPEKNPTLTNIALSWRMSDYLAERFHRGELV